MNLRSLLLSALLGLLCLSVAQSQTRPRDGVKEHTMEGRSLEAYESAAKFIRGAGGEGGLPDRWLKVENYTVTFKGERDGCYVIYFVPHDRGDRVEALDFPLSNGLPLTFYVDKTDLKVKKAVLE